MQFTSESLAKALGIGPAKTILRKHLSRKFMELIGPVAAQMKVDAMQNKTFVPLDPTEQASGHGRGRSRSVSNKRGPRKGSVEELLLPLEAYQASGKTTLTDTVPKHVPPHLHYAVNYEPVFVCVFVCICVSSCSNGKMSKSSVTPPPSSA